MKLGILSDSHGQRRRTRMAVQHLLHAGAERLLHLGDVETEEILDELAGHPCHVVFGNCDWDVPSLAGYAEDLGIQVDHPMGWVEMEGKVIAFTHGDDESRMNEALGKDADYLLHGHSHEVRDEMVGRTRVINPGALHRASRYTVATLEPGADVLRFLELPRDR